MCEGQKREGFWARGQCEQRHKVGPRSQEELPSRGWSSEPQGSQGCFGCRTFLWGVLGTSIHPKGLQHLVSEMSKAGGVVWAPGQEGACKEQWGPSSPHSCGMG